MNYAKVFMIDNIIYLRGTNSLLGNVNIFIDIKDVMSMIQNLTKLY